jgi:hypothetical protein
MQTEFGRRDRLSTSSMVSASTRQYRRGSQVSDLEFKGLGLGV